jgi:DNA primase
MTRNKDIVETLLSKVVLSDLAQTLGMSVVKRQGNLKALCPFHQDTSPSLVLYDNPTSGDRPHFHCFACGAHGDIFHLTQEKLSKNFSEAVTWLANHYGVPLPGRPKHDATQSPDKTALGFRKDGLRRALEIYAADVNTKDILQKLAETRSFNPDFLQNAGLVVSSPNVLKVAALSDSKHRRLLADLERFSN